MAEAGYLTNRVRRGLADLHARGARRYGFGTLKKRVEQLHPTVPGLQAELRAMKLAALQNAGLVEQAMQNLRQAGCRVFYARTAAEARDYILGVCDRPGILIKSKSNAVKELGIRAPLEERGVRWIETDLGDWINLLAGVEGSHVLAPAANFTRDDVRKLFSEYEGRPLDSDPPALVAAARRQLRVLLETAAYGMSGANAIAADTGTIVLMENEGNIRAVTSLPPVHIVVAGIHKVVPTLRDAIKVVHGASVYGAGQDFGTYCTTLTGPAPAGGFGPQEVHVVLVDNGRRTAIDRGYAEPFACINCGSCLNYCPVYAETGDGYGHKLLGGIGALQESLIMGLLQGDGQPTVSAEMLGLCLGCTRCVEYCPMQINTPQITFRLRAETGRLPELTRRVLDTVRSPARLKTTARLLRLYQKSGLQAFARHLNLIPRSLRTAEALQPDVVPLGPWPAVQPALRPEKGRVAMFLGCVMAEAMGDIHQATARVLRRAGFTVVTPEFRGCCGALHEHAGALADARELAKATIAGFEAVGDLPIVVNSAGCGAMMKHYGHFLKDESGGWPERAAALSRRVRDFTEFLAEAGLPAAAPAGPGRRVTYQDPCHLAHAQGITAAPRQLLQALPGVEYVEMPVTEACCGSAGIYAMGGEAQEAISLRLLETKLEDARKTGAPVVVTANPGCLMHLRYGFRAAGDNRTEVIHIATLLDRLTGGEGR